MALLAPPLGQLAEPDPVNPSVNHDLGMLAIADIAAENTGAALSGMLARQTGLILAGADPTFRLLRWLALRGSPPGNGWEGESVPAAGSTASAGAIKDRDPCRRRRHRVAL